MHHQLHNWNQHHNQNNISQSKYTGKGQHPQIKPNDLNRITTVQLVIRSHNESPTYVDVDEHTWRPFQVVAGPLNTRRAYDGLRHPLARFVTILQNCARVGGRGTHRTTHSMSESHYTHASHMWKSGPLPRTPCRHDLTCITSQATHGLWVPVRHEWCACVMRLQMPTTKTGSTTTRVPVAYVNSSTSTTYQRTSQTHS